MTTYVLVTTERGRDHFRLRQAPLSDVLVEALALGARLQRPDPQRLSMLRDLQALDLEVRSSR